MVIHMCYDAYRVCRRARYDVRVINVGLMKIRASGAYMREKKKEKYIGQAQLPVLYVLFVN